MDPAERPLQQPIEERELSGEWPSQRTGKRPKLDKFFRAMVKYGASDLHIRPGTPPYLRVDTMIKPTTSDPPTAEEIEAMASELMTAKQAAFFTEHGSIDVAYEVPGGDRFRVNVYRQRGRVSMAVRRVTRDIPDFATLHLPAVLEKISQAHQGLVLISGPTGSGKSTTIASMLEYINTHRPCHIVTIEDPIEFLHENRKALISQREIGIDAESFESALKYLMREDPDVVLIGEMRDRDTFQAALQASQTGHLVFGTVHASGAAQTIGRVLDLFPADSRDLVRQALAFNLRAVICQLLLPSIAPGVRRVPAVEILLSSPSVRQLIEDRRDTELPDLIRAGEQEGMKTFTRSLLELIEQGFIDPKVAYDHAPNVDELKMVMKGITTSRTGLVGR
ncbi:MAG: PilT/PilU family type 4a pilus ATPase [Phycisphaerae bacterium]|nr:PilT/PilU family type 4a pilus ATPase [Phycisphaerae bacterium]